MSNESRTQFTITFVCTGNTCRSPMAERLLLHALDKHPKLKDIVRVQSAGIMTLDGQDASPNALKALAHCDVSLDNHSSKQLTPEMIAESFALFGMTANHTRAIATNASKTPKHAYLVRGLMNLKGPEEQIPDPFGGDLQAYKSARDAIVEAIPSIIKFLEKELL